MSVTKSRAMVGTYTGPSRKESRGRPRFWFCECPDVPGRRNCAGRDVHRSAAILAYSERAILCVKCFTARREVIVGSPHIHRIQTFWRPQCNLIPSGFSVISRMSKYTKNEIFRLGSSDSLEMGSHIWFSAVIRDRGVSAPGALASR